METEIKTGERIDAINENLKLIQKKNGLTFGTDAYLLAAYVRGCRTARAADLGSGTGIISLLCAAREKLGRIYAVELQPDFAELIRRNAALNGLDGKITPLCADIRKIKPSDTDGELDIVFSNPPYMKTNSGKRNESDEKYIARHEVCGDIYDFAAAASRLLRHGGTFSCVYRPDRLTELFDSLRKYKLEPKRMTFVHADEKTPPSMVLLDAKKGASCGLVITPPLFLHSANDALKGASRPLSEKAQKIYDTCSFEE